MLAIVVPAGPLPLDEMWSDAMLAIQTPALTVIARGFDALGRGLGVALTVAAVGILLGLARRWSALVVFLAAEGLSTLSSTSLKALVGRERPPNGLVHPVSSSFPSGHTTYAGTTCVALVLLFTAAGPSRRPWWTLAALGIAGMAWSRTYLQVHWLSDVVAGALLGIGISLVSFGVARSSAASTP